MLVFTSPVAMHLLCDFPARRTLNFDTQGGKKCPLQLRDSSLMSLDRCQCSMGGDQCQNGGSNLEGGDFKLRGIHFKLRGGILCNRG